MNLSTHTVCVAKPLQIAPFRCTSQTKIRVSPGIRRVKPCRRYPYLSLCQVSKLAFEGILIENSVCNHHEQGVLGFVSKHANIQLICPCTRKMADPDHMTSTAPFSGVVSRLHLLIFIGKIRGNKVWLGPYYPKFPPFTG